MSPAIVVVAALVAGAVDAPAVVTQLDPPASIAGTWRCTDGDDPRFKDPAFDDSGWKQVVLPETEGRVCGQTGRAWLRRHVQLSGLRDDVVVGVSVGRVDGAYEVYVDGALVGGHGDVDGAVDPVYEGAAFAVTKDAVADGEVVVAVRVALNPVLNDVDPARRLVPGGPLVIGQMPAVDEHARVVVRDDVRERVVGFVVMLPLFLFIVAYHLIVWLLRRDRLGYLWFSISSMLVVAWLATVVLRCTPNFPLPSTTAGIIGNFFGSLVNVTFIEFFWQFVQRKRPSRIWTIWQIVLIVISLVGFIPGVGLGLTVFVPFILVKVLVPFAAVVLMVRWAIGGATDARVIFVAFVFGALAAPGEVLVEHGGGHLPFQVSPGLLAFAFFSLVMAVALSAQFARTLDDVDRKNKELRDVNASISRFVPFGFLDALEKQSVREVVRGDSRKREMAVMFCDVRGFTTLAESLGPDQTFRFINDYLSRMEPEIYKGAGFINQYLGDGIMALFPTTEVSGEKRSGADGAVSAAMGMVHALIKLNQERAKRGEPEIKIGAGIHLGQLMIGTIGGGEQLDGGVIGDVVNASARIEGMTKMYGSRVLLSGEVVAGLERVRPALRHLDVVVAKGKTEATSIYEVLELDEDAAQKKETLQLFTDAQRAYKSGQFDAAIALFDQVLAVHPRDGAARLLRERCQELKATPPEGAWTGVYALTSKS